MSTAPRMKIAYITAGAAGMFCGSCLHDNTLVAELQRLGHDALLIPTYTPIRTDEADVSLQRVFFGGINVYLQQKFSLFRHTPWFLDKPLDSMALLNMVSRFAVDVDAENLGDLTLSMLQGEHGRQSKEIAKLARWLVDEHPPDLIHLTNLLLAGMVPGLKDALKKAGRDVPILCSLQGEDIFFDALPDSYRKQSFVLLRELGKSFHGFVATSNYYADAMSERLGLPRERIHVIYPGLNLQGHGGDSARPDRPVTIGYFARICREKGLHLLVNAFRILREDKSLPPCRLKVSGWLGANQQAYWNELKMELETWGLAGDVEHTESPDHKSKVAFYQGIDILSVPTTYREPKGLYVLEALANGVPVVQPRHGSFPELIEATGGGLLVEPDDPHDLARGLRELMKDRGRREQMGRDGKRAVSEFFHAHRMAQQTLDVYRSLLS